MPESSTYLTDSSFFRSQYLGSLYKRTSVSEEEALINPFHVHKEMEQEVLQLLHETDEARYRWEIVRLMTHSKEVTDFGGCFVTPNHILK